MHCKLLTLAPIAVLLGCSEPSYEDCVRNAVDDGGSEYGIRVLTDLCLKAESDRQARLEKSCFEALESKYGAPAVQIYKDTLRSSYGRCERNADLSNEVSEANFQNMVKDAVEAGKDAAAVGAEQAAADAAAAAGEAAAIEDAVNAAAEGF